MQIKAALQHLLQEDDSILLRKGSKDQAAVRALQMGLYVLGYGKELNWNAYRADGGYGGSTTAALTAFKRANSLSGDGTTLEKSTLQKMLDRYDALHLLKAARQAEAAGELDQLFSGASGTGKTATLKEASGLSFAGPVPTAAELDQVWQKIQGFYGGAALTASAEGDPGGPPQVTTQRSRYIIADKWVRTKLNRHKKGVWTMGGDKPLTFIQSYQHDLVNSGLTESSIRVITPVSANEGDLNAINSWDNCFMTFGMFQWTLGQGSSKGELPALLLKLKEQEPEVFKRYFGQYGIGLANTSRTTGYLTLDGEKINTPAEKEKFRKGPEWAFRFWLAGIDERVKKVQIDHALDRINSFWTNDNYRPLNKYYISDLITSEYGMCLILDHHVNRPGHLMSYAIGKKDILGQALKKAGLQAKDPKTWGTTEEQKLIQAYLPLRYASSMTHSRERAAKIKSYLDKGLLRAERFSFQPALSLVKERGGLDSPATDPYPVIDHEEYEQREVLQSSFDSESKDD